MSPPAETGGTGTRWRRSDRALHRRVADGAIVLLLPDGEPELVTGPGGALWDLLATDRSLDELTAELAARYDHDPEIVRHDIARTLGGLADRGLVDTPP